MIEFYPLLLHIANIFYILGILFSDNLKLRLTLFGAGAFELSYGLFSSANGPIWEIVIWSALWSAINGYYTIVIAKERMGLDFTDDEKKVKQMSFSFMKDSQFNKIIKIAKWQNYDNNEHVIIEDSNIDKLIMIFDGIAKVEVGEKEIALLKPGNFAGEMSYLTGGKTNANVISTMPLKIVYWDRDDLNKLIEKESDLKISFHSAFNMDFIKKLENK